MSCDDWKAFFQDYASGVLSDAAREAVQRHLSECASCFADVRTLKLIDAKLSQAPEIEPPKGLIDRILALTHPAELKPRFGREFAKLAAAAAVVVGLGVAAVAYVPPERTKPIADASRSIFDTAVHEVESFLK